MAEEIKSGMYTATRSEEERREVFSLKPRSQEESTNVEDADED